MEADGEEVQEHNDIVADSDVNVLREGNRTIIVSFFGISLKYFLVSFCFLHFEATDNPVLVYLT